MRRAQNREAQRRHREKRNVPSVREQMAEKAVREGNEELAARIMEDGVPGVGAGGAAAT
jgi:hypothetical protein